MIASTLVKVARCWLFAVLIISINPMPSVAQESSKGLKSTLGRFLGGPKPEVTDDADQTEEPQLDVETPAEADVAAPKATSVPGKPAAGPTSPRGRTAGFGRPAGSGQGGLFGGGLFHQLRSVTGAEEPQAQTGDDVQPEPDAEQQAQQAPPQQRASASRAPAIEPFSKPAVPPAETRRPPVARNASPVPQPYGTGALPRTQTPPTATSLPKIVRPNEYLNRSLPQTGSNEVAASGPHSSASSGASATTSAPTGLSATNINKQLEPLDAQSSSRRSRATVPSTGAPVVGARTVNEAQVEQTTAPERALTFEGDARSADELMAATDNQQDTPSVARREASRPEFVVTGSSTRTSQMNSAEAGAGTSAANSSQLPLPDPISLPPAANAAPSSHAPTTAAKPIPTSKPLVANPNYRSPLKDLASESVAAKPVANTSPAKVASPSAAGPEASNSNALVLPENNQAKLPNSLYPAPSNSVASKSAVNEPSKQNVANVPSNVPSLGAPSAVAPSAVAANKDALMEMSIPQLRLWVEGPSKLRVDRPATYQVMAKNEGQAGVVGLLVSALVPPGVDAKNMKVDSGTIEGEMLDDKSQSLLWQLPELPPGQVRMLTVDLSASKPENFGLDIEWTVLPQTESVDLQSIQPQLLIGLEGPSEALFGKPEMYKLTIRNPGNAPVEEVGVSLTADSFGTKQAHLGTINAGDERTLEVELTFQQAGELSIIADASSSITGLNAKSDIKVNVAEVQLETACKIPERQYQGSYAVYTFSVENVGSVAANNSVCEIALPPETIVADLPEGVRFVNSSLVWDVGSMQPNSEKTIDVQLQLNALGEQPVALVAKNTHGASSKCDAVVIVETISDLKLTVVDPVAPAPVSENVTYELVIHNRGAKPARDVAVLAQFSEGIEPVSITGEEGQLVPGQVVFNPIQEIGPGEKVTLTISAVASTSGMHRFRAEVQCDGGETQLVQEESTRYLSTAAKPESTIRR